MNISLLLSVENRYLYGKMKRKKIFQNEKINHIAQYLLTKTMIFSTLK